MGHNPFLCVWSTSSCEVEGTISDVHLNSVSSLAFSNNGRLLAAVNLDEDHTISIYEWRQNTLISRFYGGSKRIMEICFSEDDHSLSICGVKEIKTWTNVQTRSPTSSRPVMGENGVLQTFLTCIYFMGSLVVGTQDGSLYIIDSSSSLRQALKAHNGPINSLDVNSLGNNFVSGSRDGTVKIWNESFECIKDIAVDNIISSMCPRVRSVAFSADNRHLLIGTRGAEVFEVNIRDSTQSGKLLVNGHGMRELWGLATHPTKDEFATCGDDFTVRIWDAKSYAVIKTIKVDVGARAIAYSRDGKYLAVGFGTSITKKVKGKAAQKEGSYSVLNCVDYKIVHEGKDSNEPIRVITFNPQSSYLAVGSEDTYIYLYSIKDNFARFCTVSCHKSPVMSVDFTMDGLYMMSVDSTKRICYSETLTGMQIGSAATLRDKRWVTWSTPVGWPVQGLWMIQPKGAEPTTALRSWGGMLVASGTAMTITCCQMYHRQHIILLANI
jgi:microtubule-associated protein-like 6